MLEQGYTVKYQGGNHDVYHRQPYMNIEMHHRLISEDSPYSGYLDKNLGQGQTETGCMGGRQAELAARR